MMMQIAALFLNNEVRTGGHRRMLELLESLAARGNGVTVILNRDLEYTPQHFMPVLLDCPYKRKSFPPISVSFRHAIVRAAVTLESVFSVADVLMIHGETHLSAALYLKKRFGVPLLYAHRSNTVREALVSLTDTANGLLGKFRSLLDIVLYRRYETKITAGCDSLVFQSPYDRDDFCARNPLAAGKSHVIRGNIGLPRFKSETQDINHSTCLKKIVFVGTLGNRKGVRHLLHAMLLVRDSGITDLELDVVGPGDLLEYWKKWAVANGMDSKIRFHGRVSNPFVLLASSDLMVVPSDFDSYPDTVLEALHAGIPVIGSMAGGIPDMLGNDELLFPVQNPKAIADIIEHAYRDTVFYDSLRVSCAGRKKMFDFDWAEAWEKVLKGVSPDQNKPAVSAKFVHDQPE